MAQPAVNRENNVLVDRNNIARKTDHAWQTRENGEWKNIDTSKIDTSKIDGSRMDTPKISRGHIDTSNIANYKQSQDMWISAAWNATTVLAPWARNMICGPAMLAVVALACGGASQVKSWICGQTPGVSPVPV